MATGGAPGWLSEVLGDGGRGGGRFGQTLVLFGLLSVVAGVGLFVLTGTFRFDPDAFRTYRRIAVGAAGYGLPAFLYGLVVVAGGGRREVGGALVGGLLSTFAVVLFLTAESGRWAVLDSPVYVAVALVVYALGATLGGVGAVGAMLLEAEPDGHEDGTGIEIDAESEFIWGEPPEE